MSASGVNIPYLPIENFKKESVYSAINPQNIDSVITNAAWDDLPKNSADDGRNTFSKEVAFILCGMRMEKYFDLFKAEDINLELFLSMNDTDLEELGITDLDDRQKITENLESHQHLKSTKADFKNELQNFKVPPSQLEDTAMTQNVLKHLVLLENNISYMSMKMKKQDLYDYFISKDKTAVQILQLLTRKCLQEVQRMEKLFLEEKNGLMDTALKVEQFSLPTHLENKLKRKRVKRNKKYILLNILTVIGLSTLTFLTVKQFFPQIVPQSIRNFIDN